MLNPYFTLITTVRLAARLAGITLYDNYAFHGALERYAGLDLGEISAAEGIADMPEKAESFALGQKCGKIIAKYLSGYDDGETLRCEARLTSEILMRVSPGAMAKYSREDLRCNITVIFKALLKRAQIRTHTAKPGGEDIHSWILSYYKLQKDYEEWLPILVEAVISPDSAWKGRNSDTFFDRSDPIIALALKGRAPGRKELDSVLDKEPATVFGRMLKDIAAS